MLFAPIKLALIKTYLPFTSFKTTCAVLCAPAIQNYFEQI